jgi:UDP-N-acetyl-D-glucosamine/UDP-N-acetyl-D-galactosamine dehydrogenase
MEKKIGVIGLGYVGLPLACLFATKYKVIGFDVQTSKIDLLEKKIDYTNEVGSEALTNKNLTFTSDSELLKNANILIVAVPTDIDSNNQPNLEPLKKASRTIGKILQKGMIIVYESTVYPGLTEEECIPILEEFSGLKWKQDFFVGYSPERINPGDKLRPIQKILKIVSGDTQDTLEILSDLYESVIEAGIYKAPSIKVAEAAKVIENAQRDLNIAFVNELSIIFDKIGIDTNDVLNAAATKWNFFKFEPGLVGGHCIGVDPYYLAYKAEQLGFVPQVIHSGRHLNNSMGNFIARKILKTFINQQKVVALSNVLILGCTFKENVGDTRNSKVVDIISGLNEYEISCVVVDPEIDKKNSNLPFKVFDEIPADIKFDAVVLSVKHSIFKKYSLELLQSKSVNKDLNLFDIKCFYNKMEAIDLAKSYWRL